MGDIVNSSLWLRKNVEIFPYKRAVVYPYSRDKKNRVLYSQITFKQLEKESDYIAFGLENAGIKRGTKTILMVTPGLEFFILIFALFKIGAVPVVVDPGMGIKRMLLCLAKTRPKAFIGIEKAHILRKLKPDFFKTIKIWVTVGKKWFWGGYTLDELRHKKNKRFICANTKANETAAILFTTGSTGTAKGVIYTHGTFNAQIIQIKKHFNIKPDEIDLPTFPLFALFDPALGMTAIIPDMDPTKPVKANPKKIIEAIENHGVTNMFVSPALLNRLGKYGKKNNIKLPSLKRVVSAGAPVSSSNIKQFSSMLLNKAQVHTPYGATEAVPVISIASREILKETRVCSEQGCGICIGYPICETLVKIIKITDEPIKKWSQDFVLNKNEIGEITVQDSVVSKGYFENPRADMLSKIKDKDNKIWHRMGDLGWKDVKGRIWFCGRKNHRVITEKETLFTIPCESIFNTHKKVFRSALVGIGFPNMQTPVICLEPSLKIKNKRKFIHEMQELACSNNLTKNINHFLIHKSFPVDIRHNSKIFREKLGKWAEKKIKF